MVSNHPAKFGGQRHCSGGDMMFLVVEGQDSTCPCFNLPFLFISKAHGMLSSHTKFQDVDIIISRHVQGKTPILVIHIHKNNWQKLLKKHLPVRPEKAMRRNRRGRRKTTCIKLY